MPLCLSCNASQQGQAPSAARMAAAFCWLGGCAVAGPPMEMSAAGLAAFTSGSSFPTDCVVTLPTATGAGPRSLYCTCKECSGVFMPNSQWLLFTILCPGQQRFLRALSIMFGMAGQ